MLDHKNSEETSVKRGIAALLMLVLLITALIACGEEEQPVYTARTAGAYNLLKQPDEDAEVLLRIPKGKRIPVYDFDPTWLLCEYDGQRGYLKRSCVESVRVVDMVNTPPYGVVEFMFIASCGGDTPVTSEPGGGEELITLHEGAWVALIGFENGYGKLIFKRQYGYIDSRCLKDLRAVDRNLDDPDTDDPIAAYVSFYNIAETESNLGRMQNIRVACEKLNELVFAPGDKLDFNGQIGPYRAANGYMAAPVLVNGTTKLGYGGGTCQVSSTLYNTVLQLPGITIIKRRAHGPSGASYLPHGVDAAVGNSSLNFIIRNDYPYPVRIDAHPQDGALYISVYRAEEE